MRSKSNRVFSSQFITDDSKQNKKEKATKPKKENGEKTKAKSTIDDIFGGLKGKPRKEEAEKQKEEEKMKRKEEKRNENKKIKRTEEGYRIYSLEELGLDKNKFGGNTPLCPFDCDCCH